MPIEFISKLFESNDPIIVMPFGGYVSSNFFHATARVLEDEGIEHSENDGIVKNILNTYKRFETDEIDGAMVTASLQNSTWNYQSDQEGYVIIDRPIELAPNTTNHTKWLPLHYELILNNEVAQKVDSQLMYPSQNASYGIISDMDDTVIDTGLSSPFKYKVIINTFFKHSSKRLPLAGALEFYKLLHEGREGSAENPFFYLSNSPWNLHEYLVDFLAKFGFPQGTLLLRDIGFENKKKASFLERNKFLRISHILETYPDLPFVLIGDAADLDHSIYIEIARKFPERILHIYIRTIRNKKKTKLVKSLIESTTDVTVTLIETSEKAIEHAKNNGLISNE